jgi:hypothetical protein
MDTIVAINGIFMANDGINMMGYNPNIPLPFVYVYLPEGNGYYNKPL